MQLVGKLYLGVLLLLTMSLVGCGGGGSSSSGSGGGGGSGGIVTRNFTSFDNLQPDSDYTLSAISIEGDEQGVGTTSRNSTFRLTIDSEDLSNVTIQTPTSSVSFSTADGDSIFDDPNAPFTFALGNNQDKAAIWADVERLDWDYQTFGSWETYQNNNVDTFGSFSAGAPTAGNNIPVSGTATYSGLTTGLFDGQTGFYVTKSDLTVNADFGARTLGFSTTNTREYSNNTPNTGLNMLGTLTYSSGSNSFSGIVNTNNGLSGTADGQFYGPRAEELGGVFYTQGGGEEYIGAFGARQ